MVHVWNSADNERAKVWKETYSCSSWRCLCFDAQLTSGFREIIKALGSPVKNDIQLFRQLLETQYRDTLAKKLNKIVYVVTELEYGEIEKKKSEKKRIIPFNKCMEGSDNVNNRNIISNR